MLRTVGEQAEHGESIHTLMRALDTQHRILLNSMEQSYEEFENNMQYADTPLPHILSSNG